AFMDDDIVLGGMGALASLAHRAEELGPGLGWVAPYCVNAGTARGFLRDRPHYSPGGILAQDELVRSILLEYYHNNTDVLDARGPRERVWELEFLTELFPAPDRAQGGFRLGPDANFLEDVVHHLAQGLGLLLVEEQRALGTALDRCARVEALDRRCLAVGKLDPHGAVISVDLNHRSQECTARRLQ